MKVAKLTSLAVILLLQGSKAVNLKSSSRLQTSIRELLSSKNQGDWNDSPISAGEILEEEAAKKAAAHSEFQDDFNDRKDDANQNAFENVQDDFNDFKEDEAKDAADAEARENFNDAKENAKNEANTEAVDQFNNEK